jgi:hypothetical protein
MTAVQRPPWVVVIRLPDDMPPVEAAHQGLGMPPGSRGLALCSEAAEQLLAALPPDGRTLHWLGALTHPTDREETDPT